MNRLCFLCVLWGGLTLAVKVALRDLPPLGLAGVRFGLGASSVRYRLRPRGASGDPWSL